MARKGRLIVDNALRIKGTRSQVVEICVNDEWHEVSVRPRHMLVEV